MHQPVDPNAVVGRATVMRPAQPATPAQLARPCREVSSDGDTVMLPTSRLPVGAVINIPGVTSLWTAQHAPAAALNRKAA